MNIVDVDVVGIRQVDATLPGPLAITLGDSAAVFVTHHGRRPALLLAGRAIDFLAFSTVRAGTAVFA